MEIAFRAKDRGNNSTVALKEYLEEPLGGSCNTAPSDW